MSFEKTFKPPQSYYDIPKAYCAFCEGEIVDRQTGLQLKNCNHHVHKTCLQDIFTIKNQCPLCEASILDGYQTCLDAPKVEPKKATRTVAVAKKKKQSINNNLDDELRRQAEQNIALQFGISGTNFTGVGEESKETAVGRRDLFRLPGSDAGPSAGRGRGRGNGPGRPPIQNRRPPRPQEEEKKSAAQNSALATGNFMGDFNLAGTQIGGTSLTATTQEST